MSQSSKKHHEQTTRMSGEGQYREQAKKLWEKLDVEGCKIINDLIVVDRDRTIWLENTESKFTRKNFQELKRRPYTRPQLSKNVQNIIRHHR